MTAFLEKFLRFGDWLLVTVVLVLLGIGLIAVWSFSPPASGLFFRQLLWLAIGLTAFFVFSILDYRIFRNHGLFLVVLYGVVMVILASLLVFAPPTRGVRAWPISAVTGEGLDDLLRAAADLLDRERTASPAERTTT